MDRWPLWKGYTISLKKNITSENVRLTFNSTKIHNMIMAPTMGASAAESRGGTMLLWLGPGAREKPSYVAPLASPAVHHVLMALGKLVMTHLIIGCFVYRPTGRDERATAI